MKDLFRLAFSQISTYSHQDYEHDFVQQAPLWLLHSAMLAQEGLRTKPGFEEVYSFLRDRSSSVWNNPELYPHLFRLLRSSHGQSRSGSELSALEGHLGLRSVSAEMFTHRFLRVRYPQPTVFELSDKGVAPLEDVTLEMEQEFPIVYLPLPHLFDDVVGGTVQYVGSKIPIAKADIQKLISNAASILQAYDPDLYEGFLQAVGTLGVTGDWAPGSRTSYSSGAYYTGGIFASVCTDSPALLVESLIHEYYHQRLWMWWLIDAPADMPDKDHVIVSPVSGQTRSVQIMMQALLIYVSLADYYGWAAQTITGESDWAQERCRTLKAGAKELFCTLRSALAERPVSLRFIETLDEYQS